MVCVHCFTEFRSDGRIQIGSATDECPIFPKHLKVKMIFPIVSLWAKIILVLKVQYQENDLKINLKIFIHPAVFGSAEGFGFISQHLWISILPEARSLSN